MSPNCQRWTTLVLIAVVLSVPARVAAQQPPIAQQPCVPALFAADGTFLGRLSANTHDPESVNNRFGQYGSQYSSTSIDNKFGPYGNPFSADSPTNRYTSRAPTITDPCTGKYLGQLSANPFAADSTANRFGQYGNPYSTDSINNRFGPYGSPYSSSSVRNPYAVSSALPMRPTLAVPNLEQPTMPFGGIDWSIPLRVTTPPPSAPPNLLDTMEQALRIRQLQLDVQQRAMNLRNAPSQPNPSQRPEFRPRFHHQSPRLSRQRHQANRRSRIRRTRGSFR
jgi:hypothetical protein